MLIILPHVEEPEYIITENIFLAQSIHANPSNYLYKTRWRNISLFKK